MRIENGEWRIEELEIKSVCDKQALFLFLSLCFSAFLVSSVKKKAEQKKKEVKQLRIENGELKAFAISKRFFLAIANRECSLLKMSRN